MGYVQALKYKQGAAGADCDGEWERITDSDECKNTATSLSDEVDWTNYEHNSAHKALPWSAWVPGRRPGMFHQLARGLFRQRDGHLERRACGDVQEEAHLGGLPGHRCQAGTPAADQTQVSTKVGKYAHGSKVGK